jgi:hypothetical protein
MVRPLIGLLVCMALLPSPTRAQTPTAPAERRVFRIFVDEKLVGQYRMAIRQQHETSSMTAQADIYIERLPMRYSYTFRSVEVWSGDHLVHLDSTGVDNRKPFAVAARIENGALRVTCNGRERDTTLDAWPTTFWRLPASKLHNQVVPLLDDTGKDVTATLSYVGIDNVPVAGVLVPCAHWQLAGGVQADLWYDGSNRLVRHESVEAGHKTVLDLVEVHH